MPVIKKITYFIYFQLQRLWYQPKLSKVLWIFLPFSGLFYLGLQLKKMLFFLKWRVSHRLPVPVIVVGNLNVGGTGKTPFVIYLAKVLARQKGIFPGIVSRGAGGKLPQYPVRVLHDAKPEIVGDEAILLMKHSGCPVVIDRDRVRAARFLLEQSSCNMIISDDGLQHMALSRDFEIVLIDGVRQMGNQYVLPAGPLREPVRRLATVDCVIINQNDVGVDKSDDVDVDDDNEHRLMFCKMQLHPAPLISLLSPGQQQYLEQLSYKTVHAVAAIGHPERFFALLRSKHLNVIPHVFPDHYVYQSIDFDFKEKLPVIMTEKDAVKCEHFAKPDWWYLPVIAELSHIAQAAILSRLAPFFERCCKNKSNKDVASSEQRYS